MWTCLFGANNGPRPKRSEKSPRPNDSFRNIQETWLRDPFILPSPNLQTHMDIHNGQLPAEDHDPPNANDLPDTPAMESIDATPPSDLAPEEYKYEYFISFFHVTALGEPSFGTLGFTFPHRLRLHLVPSLHQTALAELTKRGMSTRGFQITSINLLAEVPASDVVAPSLLHT